MSLRTNAALRDARRKRAKRDETMRALLASTRTRVAFVLEDQDNPRRSLNNCIAQQTKNSIAAL